MESHADREEVQQALKTGEGESTRYSATLLQKTLYYARRLGDGTVLRISVSRATAGLLILGVLQPMLLVLAAALILSGVLAGGSRSGSSTRSTGSTSTTRCTAAAMRSWRRCSGASTSSTARSPRSCARCAARRTSSTRSPAA